MRQLSGHITRRNSFAMALFALLVGIAGAYWLSPFQAPTEPESREEVQQRIATLKAWWSKGNVIVFIRHAERCDHSESPCLDDPDGITVRGRDQALAIGRAFDELGAQYTDVFASPSTRTKQTASYMFRTPVTENRGLANCKTISLDEFSLAKSSGRNLALVTHSHCIERLERLLSVNPFKETDYGSLLFVSIDDITRKPVSARLIHAVQFVADFQPPRQPSPATNLGSPIAKQD